MFCGITMKNYVAENVSTTSLTTVKCGLKVLSNGSESIIFMFLGISTVNDYHEWNTAFIALTIFFCTLYRALGNNNLHDHLHNSTDRIFLCRRCAIDRNCQLLPSSSAESSRKICHVLRRVAWGNRFRVSPSHRPETYPSPTAFCYRNNICCLFHGVCSGMWIMMNLFISAFLQTNFIIGYHYETARRISESKTWRKSRENNERTSSRKGILL